MTSRTRGSLAALAVCALLWAGPAGCGAGGARGSGTQEKSPAPVGKVIDHTDEEGRPYREVARQEAPEVGVEVRPDADGSWDVRLTVRRFRFSPAGTAARAAAGRGLARLLVDGRPVGRLRAPDYRLSARLVPRGTHHVTARLYADDDTVWAVSGSAVQSTADITASGPAPGAGASSGAGPSAGAGASAGAGPSAGAGSASGAPGAGSSAGAPAPV
ncbi:nuclear transport factor 2 family protein, partial [Streptomyces seoulensis]